MPLLKLYRNACVYVLWNLCINLSSSFMSSSKTASRQWKPVAFACDFFFNLLYFSYLPFYFLSRKWKRMDETFLETKCPLHYHHRKQLMSIVYEETANQVIVSVYFHPGPFLEKRVCLTTLVAFSSPLVITAVGCGWFFGVRFFFTQQYLCSRGLTETYQDTGMVTQACLYRP